MSKPASDFPAALPLQTRTEPIDAVDAEKRVVNVIWTTGAAVRRRRWVGYDTAVPFDEILTVSREAVDLARLNAGAPALDSHSTYTTYAQVGVVENARIDGGKGLAQVRFPSKGVDDAADRMFAMVDEKIIRNISVGYIINAVRIIPADEKKGTVEQRIATLWTPYEVSFVTVNADAGAQTRAADLATFPLAVVRVASLGAIAARMRMRQLQI